MTISRSIIDAVGKWLGEEGIRYFAHIKGLKSTVNCILKLNYARKRMPFHPVYLREGMQIRNFMRSLPDCDRWSFHDFDQGWVQVLDILIEEYKHQGNENK
jgi:hypothetical protein